MAVHDSSGAPQQVSVTIKQQKFSSEGFASTGVAGSGVLEHGWLAVGTTRDDLSLTSSC
jgi:hypothetical protein